MSAFEDLRPDERELVAAYADKNSPTYGNKSRSLKQARPHITDESAYAMTSETFGRTRIKNAITEYLEKYGASYEVRLKERAEIATNKVRDVITTTQYDENGKLVGTTVVDKPVPAAVRARQLDALAEMTGEDATVKAHNRLVSAEMERIGKSMLRDARKMVPERRVEAHASDAMVNGGTIESEPSAALHDAPHAAPHNAIADAQPTDADDTQPVTVYGKVDMRDLVDTGDGYGEGGSQSLVSLPSPPHTPEPKTQGGLVDYERLLITGESGVIGNSGEFD